MLGLGYVAAEENVALLRNDEQKYIEKYILLKSFIKFIGVILVNKMIYFNLDFLV